MSYDQSLFLVRKDMKSSMARVEEDLALWSESMVPSWAPDLNF